mgnify:FL=1
MTNPYPSIRPTKHVCSFAGVFKASEAAMSWPRLEDTKMRSYPNIERINGHLVGYDKAGNSWRIFGRCGNWNAKATIGYGQLIKFDRLVEISEELASWERKYE